MTSTKPWSERTSPPISASPRRWMSILRGPRLQPPGIATRACPKRATSGPMIWMEARMRCTSSYGATCDCTAVVSMVMVPSRELHHGAQVLQHLLHGVHVLDVGHVVQHAGARGQQRGGHELEGRVLGPRHGHLSGQAAAHRAPAGAALAPALRRASWLRPFGDFQPVLSSLQRQLLPIGIDVFALGHRARAGTSPAA